MKTFTNEAKGNYDFCKFYLDFLVYDNSGSFFSIGSSISLYLARMILRWSILICINMNSSSGAWACNQPVRKKSKLSTTTSEQKSEIIEEQRHSCAELSSALKLFNRQICGYHIRDYSVSAPTRQIQIIMRTVNRRTVYNLQFQWSSRLLWKQCLLTKMNKEVISNDEHA